MREKSMLLANNTPDPGVVSYIVERQLSKFRDTHFTNSKVDGVGWDGKRIFFWWRNLQALFSVAAP